MVLGGGCEFYLLAGGIDVVTGVWICFVGYVMTLGCCYLEFVLVDLLLVGFV